MGVQAINFASFKAAAGGGYDSDAQAFFTATGITDNTIKDAVDDLVVALKAASVWTKCIAIYPFVGGDATKHSYNLKNTAQYQITWSGTVTHNANGITGNGTDGFGISLNPSSASMDGSNYHLAIYSRSSGASAQNQIEIGAYDGVGAAMFLGCRFQDTCIMYGGATSGNVSFSNTDGQGFYLQSRRSDTDLEAYKNGSSSYTLATSNTTTPPNLALRVLDFNGSPNKSTKNLAFASVGSGLTDTEAADFNTAVEAFQDALSRGVV